MRHLIHRWGKWDWHPSKTQPGISYEYRICRICGKESGVRTLDIYDHLYGGR
jgi:hypothetical protein